MSNIDGYKDLAYAIVEQAIDDYRAFKNDNRRKAPLVRFFKSKWCDLLLHDFEINGVEILAKLESE